MQTLSRQSNLLCEGEMLLMHILPFAFCGNNSAERMNKLFRIFSVPGFIGHSRDATENETIPIGNIYRSLVVNKMYINKFFTKNWFIANISEPFLNSQRYHFSKLDFRLKCFIYRKWKNFVVFCFLVVVTRTKKLCSHIFFKVMPLNDGKWNLKNIFVCYFHYSHKI